MSPEPIRSRIERRVTREDRGHTSPCWIWEGATDKDGYPHMNVYEGPSGSRRKRLVRVQRVVHSEYVGPIPEGYEVDHLCHVVQCLNPAHLEAVTPAENLRRRRRRRATETQCANGHGSEHRNTSGGCRVCNREAMARVRARLRGDDVPFRSASLV
jgi:hypothetical protein